MMVVLQTGSEIDGSMLEIILVSPLVLKIQITVQLLLSLLMDKMYQAVKSSSTSIISKLITRFLLFVNADTMLSQVHQTVTSYHQLPNQFQLEDQLPSLSHHKTPTVKSLVSYKISSLLVTPTQLKLFLM
jgi:hypothetical protein